MSTAINERIVNWIVKRAKKEYADDIAMVLAYGSFVNGTANAKSDVDCYFIPKTERGYQFSVSFILNDIGYDIFPMSWERVENISNLKDVLLPCVGDARVLFYSTNEDLEKFNRLKNKMFFNLRDSQYTKEIAKKRFTFACNLYARMKTYNQLSDIRTCAGYIIMALADAVAVYNQDYFHFGLKKQYEDLQRFKLIPQGFIEDYLSVMKAETAAESQYYCDRILKSVSRYMEWEFIIENEAEERNNKNNKLPDYAALAALYEEISSTFNKIYVCCEEKNYVLGFLSAACLQRELKEASQENNVPYYDIMGAFCYDNLFLLAEKTKKIEAHFVQMIMNGGGNIKRFSDFEDFEKTIL